MNRVVLVVVLTSAFVGCDVSEETPADSGSFDATWTDAARDGAPDVGASDVGVDARDTSCVRECFGNRLCRDGVVYQVRGIAVPCDEWTGTCPSDELGRCESGCGDRVVSDSGSWERFCAGMEERLAGDPCETDDDCQVPAPIGGARGYLACDEETSRCVAIEPPTYEVAACGDVDLDALSTRSGVVRDESCASGWCRFIAREAPECDPRACAMTCVDDWDCAPSFHCREVSDWTGWTFGEPEGELVRICSDVDRFGQEGLTCP
jgi:hypothetical protein